MAIVQEPPHDDEVVEQTPVEHLHVTPGSLEQRKPRYGQPFFPAAIAGSSVYILATVIALVFLALVHPADSFYTDHANGAVLPADPENHAQYLPRPEWYFLFLFQILKYFQGPWELVGTAVIPGLLGVILLGLPFYDRNWSRRAVRRPVAVGLGGLFLAAIAYLTYIPIQGAGALNAGLTTYSTTVLANPKWTNVEAIFTKNCSGCHVAPAGGAGYLGGLNLETYAATMKGGAISGGGVINGSVIKAGNAQASYLYLVNTWDTAAYHKLDRGLGANMPLGKSKIATTDLQNIKNWINNGAKNTQ